MAIAGGAKLGRMATRPVTPAVNLVRAMLRLRDLTGRDLAIFGCAWLDAAVQLNLEFNMRALAGRAPDKRVFGGGLRGLESRLWVADAFGFFATEEVRAQADLVRVVRNEFAHSIEDLDCNSPRIAQKIGHMTLTTEQVQRGLARDPDGPSYPSEDFEFDGEFFDGGSVAAIVDVEPARIVFFVPATTDPRSQDDRLRNQIHAAVLGVLGIGLTSWLDHGGREGVVLLSESQA